MPTPVTDPQPPDVLDPELRLDPVRWGRVQQLAAELVSQHDVPAIAYVAGRGNRATPVVAAGSRKIGESATADTHAADENTIFLVASLTKPVVAMAALKLLEQGALTLGDRVSTHLPEFGSQHKHAVTIRHLLTHTSGLPDQLPNNQALRSEEAPLSRFFEGTCAVSLGFSPGRGVQYQSMGFVALAEIIARISGVSCAEFCQREIFEPLGMRDTVLGTPNDWYAGQPAKTDRIAEVWLPEERRTATGHWNSRYWWSLGAPWGGMLSTAADIGRFCRLMINGGRARGTQLFNKSTVDAAVTNQLEFLRDIPAEDRRCRPWGLGWRLNWDAHEANFSDVCSPATYGHWGATGTVMWVDPVRNLWAVVLTSRPQAGPLRHITRLSNAIASAFFQGSRPV